MSRVLGGDGQPGCGESLVGVLVDGVECGVIIKCSLAGF